MDQPWLDAVEWAVPAVHTKFLDEDEKQTRSDALESIGRGQASNMRKPSIHETWFETTTTPPVAGKFSMPR